MKDKRSAALLVLLLWSLVNAHITSCQSVVRDPDRQAKTPITKIQKVTSTRLLSAERPLRAKTPGNYMIAFIGDQGLGENAQAVLKLIKNEGAEAVVHSGDFDYQGNPAAWEAQINAILGSDFPYFASPGNHDADRFYG